MRYSVQSLRVQLLVGLVAVALLTGVSLLAIAAVQNGGWGGHRFGRSASCTVPNLPGIVVHVSLENMGGPMMAQGGMMSGGAMRLTTDRSTAPNGSITFVATNFGTITHELVILPLPDGQVVGTRPIGSDGTIDESGSVAEASASCAAGGGEGIVPGSSSWVTVTLAPGRYELVCNLPGHYAAGMYAQITAA